MSLTIQHLPNEIKCFIFRYLESNNPNTDKAVEDLDNVMQVCKLWKKIIEGAIFLSNGNYTIDNVNLIIDRSGIVIIDKDLYAKNNLLIRARCIFSKDGICLTAKQVTLVAERIHYLGLIKAENFIMYFNQSHVKEHMPARISYHLQPHSAKATFWPLLLTENQKEPILQKNQDC